jgi:hypothetical protein
MPPVSTRWIRPRAKASRYIVTPTRGLLLVMGHTDFLRVDEQGQEEWVSCGLGDTLVAPLNALHAFHNRTDEPSRFISSSVQLATQDEVPLWLIALFKAPLRATQRYASRR